MSSELQMVNPQLISTNPKSAKKLSIGQKFFCYNVERVSPVKLKMGAKSHIKPLDFVDQASKKLEFNFLQLENLIGKPESVNVKGPLAVKILQIGDEIVTKNNKLMR